MHETHTHREKEREIQNHCFYPFFVDALAYFLVAGCEVNENFQNNI